MCGNGSGSRFEVLWQEDLVIVSTPKPDVGLGQEDFVAMELVQDLKC